MKREPHIEAEIREIASELAQMPFEMPYRVPAGYFETLAGNIQDKLATGMDSVYKQYPGSLPEDYFSTLPTQIMDQIHALEVREELETIAPLLNGISKGMPFSKNPKAEKISIDIAAITSMKAEEVTGAKVVAMPAKSKSRVMYWAAAAMVAVLLTSAYFFSGDRNAVENSTLTEYANLNVAEEINKLPVEDLNNYLGTTDKNLVAATADRDVVTSYELPDVNEHIELMSDDELKQYLEEIGADVPTTGIDTNS
jgi:hypothetical protein